jgi:hypothetical protein
MIAVIPTSLAHFSTLLSLLKIKVMVHLDFEAEQEDIILIMRVVNGRRIRGPLSDRSRGRHACPQSTSVMPFLSWQRSSLQVSIGTWRIHPQTLY